MNTMTETQLNRCELRIDEELVGAPVRVGGRPVVGEVGRAIWNRDIEEVAQRDIEIFAAALVDVAVGQLNRDGDEEYRRRDVVRMTPKP